MTASIVKLGNDYMLWLGTPIDTPVFSVVKGQGTATINRSQKKIDTSSKDTQGYATSAYGLKDLTIDLDIVPTLPDATGYTALEALCNASPAAPFPIEIRKGGSAGTETDAIFSASVYGTITSVAFTQDDKVTAKVQFALAAAPTVDALA